MIHFFKEVMSIDVKVLKNSFLFCKMDESKIEELLSLTDPQVKKYERGECIFSPDKAERKLGFVLSGECEVKHLRKDESFVILNTISAPESFGILSVFSENEDYPTYIFARKNAAVLFFSKEDIDILIEKSPEISKNVIAFLTKKIMFLNKKVSTYSGGSVEEKLCGFLYSEYEKYGEEFPLNCKRCSEALGVGRASVYRALDALVSEQIITFTDKKIKIISLNRLERN
jgi:CRP-like cAMP-binding protein